MAVDGAFTDLRKLSDWFARPGLTATTLQMVRLTRRLGSTAVPLLGRALRSDDAVRREAAREALAVLATTDARARVIGELRTVTLDTSVDESKVCALGLLAELGERGAARFADPTAIQRRSALALATQLETSADVASAADMMIRQLAEADVMQMVSVLLEVAPNAAHRLGSELAVRLDVTAAQRDRIAALVATAPTRSLEAGSRRAARPTQVAVLVDAAARIVVVASRRIASERRSRRWRRWAVLIGANGCIDDCLHEDDASELGASDPGAPLIANLCADGYRVASSDLHHARTVVAAAVRRTAVDPARLGSTYYLGRDLLDLGDTHVIRRLPRESAATAIDRALELLAGGESGPARALLDDADPASPDVCGALAACMLAHGDDAAAVAVLDRAIAAEPSWPLHHWNLATAQHRLGDLRRCYHALRRFVATSALPSGLYGDPEQPGRVACAERMLAEIERTAR
ncbi:MAG: Tetratricopeptide 2 repeat protein, partial [Deltaproteobacteria bacterium]|nr:Tetratricopeptide 2 repeat protein [Deltaproteobacteria bacterium]